MAGAPATPIQGISKRELKAAEELLGDDLPSIA